MAIGLVGQKCGMTRVFLEDGTHVPVTVIKVEPNRITQVKTKENDGYTAIQVTMGNKKQSRVNKPDAGQFAKANTEAGFGLWEFLIGEEQSSVQVGDAEVSLDLGQQITVSLFQENDFVDVAGVSKGKGFAGTVKRYNFRTQDATHGNSRSHRSLGSTGQNQTPGKVFKGKKMPGHLGNVNCSVQNLQVVKVDLEKNLLLIKGAVPGSISGYVVIKPAVKKQSGEK